MDAWLLFTFVSVICQGGLTEWNKNDCESVNQYLSCQMKERKEAFRRRQLITTIQQLQQLPEPSQTSARVTGETARSNATFRLAFD